MRIFKTIRNIFFPQKQLSEFGKKRIRVCPKCFEPVEVFFTPVSSIVPVRYVCEKCGYSSYLFLETDEQSLHEFKTKKQEMEIPKDTST